MSKEKLICDYCNREVKNDPNEYMEVAGIMCNKCYGTKPWPELEKMKKGWEEKFNEICEEKKVNYFAIVPLSNFIAKEIKKAYQKGKKDILEKMPVNNIGSPSWEFRKKELEKIK